MRRQHLQCHFIRNESFDSVRSTVDTEDLVTLDMVYINQCFAKFGFDL